MQKNLLEDALRRRGLLLPLLLLLLLLLLLIIIIIIITNSLSSRYATEKLTGNFIKGDELQDNYKFRTREKYRFFVLLIPAILKQYETGPKNFSFLYEEHGR
jgi:hypothetical protein